MSGKNLLAGVSREQLDQEARAVINGEGRNLLDGVDRAEIDKAAREIINRDQARKQARSQPKAKPKADPAVASITGLGNRRPATQSVSDQFERAQVDPTEREAALQNPSTLRPAERAGTIARADDRISELEQQGYLGQQRVKFGQMGLGLAGDAARMTIALGDAGKDVQGELPGDAFIRETLTDFAITSEAIGSRKVAGTTSFEDVKNDPTQALKFIADEGPASLAISPLLLNPYGLGAFVYSQTGGIGQERAVNNGRDQANLGDVAIAAPFAAGSAALDRFGFERLLTPGAGNVATRILKGGATEAITEGTQGAIETLGGSLGTERGVDGNELFDNVVGGAIVGGGAGAGFRGGIELVDGTGRLVRRNPNDTRAPAPGNIERAVEAASTPTQADIDSPLDTGDIAEGKAIIAQAQAEKGTERELGLIGMPNVGTRVTITDPELGTQSGTMRDRFTGPDGSGVVIELDGGKIMREFDDTLADLGISITAEPPANMTAEADAIDAQLAEKARNAISAGVPSQAPVEAPSPVAADPLLSQEATGGGAPSFDMNRYLARNSQIESNNRPYVKAGTSSASGLFQFTKKTWIGVGGQWGNDPSQAFGGLKPSEAEQRQRAQKLTEQNVAAVKRAGAPVTDGNVYLAHFLGQGGAAAVLGSNPNTPVSQILKQEQIDANKSILDGKTAGEVIAWAARKMGQAAPVAGETTPVSAPEAEAEAEAESGGRQRTSMLDVEGASIPEFEDGRRVDVGAGQEWSASSATIPGNENQPTSYFPTLAVFEKGKATEIKVLAGGTWVSAKPTEAARIADRFETEAESLAAGKAAATQEASQRAERLANRETIQPETTEEFIARVKREKAERQTAREADAPQAAPVGGDLPAPQAMPPAQEAAPAGNLGTVQIAPGRTEKSIMLINPSAATIEMLRSTVPQAKATPRDKDGNVSFPKKHEAAIRAAIAADAPSAQRGGQSAEMEARRKAAQVGPTRTVTVEEMAAEERAKERARKPLINQVEEEIAEGISDPERRQEVEEYLTDLSDPEMAVTPEVNQRAIAALAKLRESEQTGGDIAGEQISDEWTAFSDDSGTLNIPRAEMPQIKAEHRGAMVNFLNAREIAHSEEEIEAGALKPSQAEFSPSKVEKAKQ